MTEAEYTSQGLNHALRIGSIGYVYEPELDRWTHDYRTPEGFFAQHQLTADDIHEIVYAGKYRVTVWEVAS